MSLPILRFLAVAKGLILTTKGAFRLVGKRLPQSVQERISLQIADLDDQLAHINKKPQIMRLRIEDFEKNIDAIWEKITPALSESETGKVSNDLIRNTGLNFSPNIVTDSDVFARFIHPQWSSEPIGEGFLGIVGEEAAKVGQQFSGISAMSDAGSQASELLEAAQEEICDLTMEAGANSAGIFEGAESVASDVLNEAGVHGSEIIDGAEGIVSDVATEVSSHGSELLEGAQELASDFIRDLIPEGQKLLSGLVEFAKEAAVDAAKNIPV